MPAVWEDLPSFVRRCSEQMGYERSEWMLSPEKSEWHVTASQLPGLRYQYHLLGSLLNVEEEVLYRLTVHRFAPVLSQKKIRVVQEIDRLLVAATPYVSTHLSVSVCPSCVAELESYDRLYWRLPLALVCPRHGQVLRHRCPHCQHPIKSLRTHAYRCGFCSQGDYRKEVARALGPSSAVLNASWWMLQLAGVEGEEFGISSRGAMSMPERFLCFWRVSQEHLL